MRPAIARADACGRPPRLERRFARVNVILARKVNEVIGRRFVSLLARLADVIGDQVQMALVTETYRLLLYLSGRK